MVKGTQIFFIKEAIPNNIRRLQFSKLPHSAELGSTLRSLGISTFNDLIGVSLRDLQRVSDKSAALFLELSRLIKLAAAGKTASVSKRGTGGDHVRNARYSSAPRKGVSGTVQRATGGRPYVWSDEQAVLPKHLIPVLPWTRPSPMSPPDWHVRPKRQNLDAMSSRQPVHPPEDLVSGSHNADHGRATANDRDDWLASRIFIPISERGRSLRTPEHSTIGQRQRDAIAINDHGRRRGVGDGGLDVEA